MDIMKILKKFLPRRKKYNDISEFFLHASSKEKVKLLKEVARKANQEQKALMDKYDKLYPNGTQNIR